MEDAREESFRRAVQGHSFLLTGQCGTGKTHLLRRIIKEIRQKRVTAVTASTGMASLQLGVGGTTLHHWSGILDGRYSHQTLGELFDGDDRFADAKKRILETQCLVIDEISMLSARTFDMIEFVCRHVRRCDQVFGGMQVIGCGDFKQLPPVPNFRYEDDGSYCFQSNKFHMTFPHHINLLEVLRQSEFNLIKAVNELCDGKPSQETIQFLRSLDRPLDAPPEDITRLYGTNFDTRVVNQDMLEQMDGEMVSYKAKDKGDVRRLLELVAPKTLLLKKGAKVILIKNIADGLFNGMTGTVHHLERGSPPVVNFSGNLVTVSETTFEVYDSRQQKTLGSRTQIPLILAFALTVHRAQGQTLHHVEVDCYSFFAPGQMGVAIGRAVTTSGLRILNFNQKAASTKHPDLVYEFYDRQFMDFRDDLLCCNQRLLSLQSSEESLADKPTHSSHTDQTFEEDLPGPSKLKITAEFPQLEAPWNIHDFVYEMGNVPYIVNIPKDFFSSSLMLDHINFLYFKIKEIINDQPKSPKQWTQSFTKLNSFVLSDQHLMSVEKLFQQCVTNMENKFSTKLAYWLMDKEIEKRARDIIQKQKMEAEQLEITSTLSSVAKGKIRYLAGACIQRVNKRIKESVLRLVGKCGKKSRTLRKLNYKKQAMLKSFRVSEQDVDTSEDTMNEIQYKQGPSHGLTIVSEPVYNFFVMLNQVTQKSLSAKHFHLYYEDLHTKCRDAVDSDNTLIDTWISLFQNVNLGADSEKEDELFLTLIMELFRDVTEHFVRIAFVDALRHFKTTVPRKKKQALRTKVQALGDRDESAAKAKKTKVDEAAQEVFICKICEAECEWEPAETKNESLACDKCNGWFHYKCVKIKGTEAFLKKAGSWFCTGCSKKGKGKGKGKSKSSK